MPYRDGRRKQAGLRIDYLDLSDALFTTVHSAHCKRPKAVPIIRMSITNMTNIYKCREEYRNKAGIIFIQKKVEVMAARAIWTGVITFGMVRHSSQVVLSN